MIERQHRAPLLGFAFAFLLTALNLSTADRAAGVVPETRPACVRVPLGDGAFRLYLHPGEVVRGTVVSVRSGRLQWSPRRDGVWVSEQPRGPRPSSDWHVVIKSDATLFSERRYSTWVRCGRVKVRPVQVG